MGWRERHGTGVIRAYIHSKSKINKMKSMTQEATGACLFKAGVLSEKRGSFLGLLSIPVTYYMYLKDRSTYTIVCEGADQTSYLAQAQYPDNGPASANTENASLAWWLRHLP